jgi:SlyX protein
MKTQSESIEKRMIVLEEKLEYQDYTLEKLNEVIIAQQNQIDKLENELARLREKMEANDLEVDESGGEPPPPHY